jgi:hypothetical protein
MVINMISKFNLVGLRFGRLIVISDTNMRNKCGHIIWTCRCDCGNDVMISSSNLRSGHSASCGCLARERSINKNTIHGCSSIRTRGYGVWMELIQRCTNHNNKGYYKYGGRGIKVCDRWLKFENFLADMGECPEDMSLERIDNDGDYCKENCKWATRHEQNRNKRNNVWVELNGERMIITDAIRILCIASATFYLYMKKHELTHQEAINHYSERMTNES